MARVAPFLSRLVVILLGVVACGATAADEPPAAPLAVPQPDEGAAPASRRRIDEVGPEIFYLEDDGGRAGAADAGRKGAKVARTNLRRGQARADRERGGGVH